MLLNDKIIFDKGCACLQCLKKGGTAKKSREKISVDTSQIRATVKPAYFWTFLRLINAINLINSFLEISVFQITAFQLSISAARCPI